MGEYITLRERDKIKICLGEVPGGNFSGRLHVQLKSVEYKKDEYDDPVLHPFISGELTAEEKAKLPPSLFNLEKIPVFKFKKEEKEQR